MSYQMNGFRQRLITHIGHAVLPAIIFPNGQQYVVAVDFQNGDEKFSTSSDVEVLGNSEQNHSKIEVSENSRCPCSYHWEHPYTCLG